MSRTVAFHTLGCKVNQYDSQAMLELFRAAGYQAVPFDGPADVYVINTCTVTGVGDKKSLQLARRVRREHPESALVLCGCLAQRRGEELLAEGASLVLGTQARAQIVPLLEHVRTEGKPLCAVEPLREGLPYEPLRIHGQEEHTRATLKIQEGCNNRCTYCVIPSVRGPIRSRPPEDIAREARALTEAGFPELVLTGIHLTSTAATWAGTSGCWTPCARSTGSRNSGASGWEAWSRTSPAPPLWKASRRCRRSVRSSTWRCSPAAIPCCGAWPGATTCGCTARPPRGCGRLSRTAR